MTKTKTLSTLAIPTPRKWQKDAINDIRSSVSYGARCALMYACPGAGKTLASLFIALDLITRFHPGRKIIIVTPNEAIRSQWIEKARLLGLELIAVRRGEDLLDERLDFGASGFIMSYQLIANDKNGVKYALRHFCSTHLPIVILDEVHHSAVPHVAPQGGNDWGEVIEFACKPASFVLCTTGTPFREKTGEKIAFVDYRDDDHVVNPTVRYGYDLAIRDAVCRPIEFVMFDGFVEFVEKGEHSKVVFGSDADPDQAPGGLRAAWEPTSPLCREMLEHAHAQLLEVREGSAPVDASAGGLVVARDVEHADALASLVESISGEKPIVVHSKIDDAQDRIEAFRRGKQFWIIAVSMLSEGVDIQRLRVGVYATTKRASLYIHQFCGRFARVQAPAGSDAARAERSYVFMPYDPGLEAVVIDIQKFKAHALDEEVPTHVERLTVGKPGGRRGPKSKIKIISADGKPAGSLVGPHFVSVGLVAQHKEWIRSVRATSNRYAHLSDAEMIVQGIQMLAIPSPPDWGLNEDLEAAE